MSEEIIPLFSTSNSLKEGGIFTVEKAGEKEKQHRKSGPVSLCDLAKEEGLKQMYLVESEMAAFMQAQKNLKLVNCDMHFGLRLVVCQDMNDKSEASFKTESKVVIWPAIDSPTVYEKFIKISSKAAQDGFYYVPRIDWKTLCAMWSDDLLLSLPFYSSFLAKNTLTFASIVPQLPAQPLIFREVGQELPVDDLINDSIERYIASTAAEVQNVKSIYYKSREDAKAFLIYRCVLNRMSGSSYDVPNLDGMNSCNFSWEHYKELTR